MKLNLFIYSTNIYVQDLLFLTFKIMCDIIPDTNKEGNKWKLLSESNLYFSELDNREFKTCTISWFMIGGDEWNKE